MKNKIQYLIYKQNKQVQSMYRARANYQKQAILNNNQYSQYSSCQKDFTNINTYQQKYNNINVNNTSTGFQANRQQSRNILKQITDKYGFYWDEKGKLLKNKQDKSVNNLNVNGNRDKLKNQRGINFKQPRSVNQKIIRGKQNSIFKNKQNYFDCQKIVTYEEQMFIKSQIHNIDQKINSIFNKYKKQRPSEKDNNVGDYKKINKRNRMITEQNGVKESPHFGYYNNNHDVSITRSKSTNMLPNLSKNSLKYNEKIFTQSKQNQYKNATNINYKQQKIQLRQLKFQEQERVPQLSPRKMQIIQKIDNITKKIKQCEKQKQKLNIEFKRFDVRQNCKTPQKYQLNNKTLTHNNLNKNFENIKQKQEKKPLNVSKNIIKKSNNISITPKRNITNKLQQKFDEQQGLQNNQLYQLKQEKNNIIAKFCRQIQLDQQFRNAKLWLQNNQDPHKWGILADKLAMNGKQYKYRDLVSIFSCTLEEHNPFFSIKNSHQSYSSLLSTFIQNQRHWKEQIENKFQMEDLVNEQFNTRQLDIQQKGFVRVEDFVRYVNMRTNNFYRSRDLLLLFQRFAGKDKKEVYFSTVLEVILVQNKDY